MILATIFGTRYDDNLRSTTAYVFGLNIDSNTGVNDSAMG